MRWRLTTTAAIVLVLTSTMATHAANSGHERDIPEWEQYWAELGKIYRRVKTSEIRYGTEVGPSRYIGEIDPPFVTPDPDQVEVIAFAAFTHRAWIINYPLMIRWIKTLPDNVNVQFLPTKSLRQGNINPRHRPLRAVRQNLYQTALRMGVPYRKAHRTIQTMGIGNFWTLEDERSQNRYARKLRLDPEQFQALRTHPAVQWKGQVADWLELAQAGERWRVAKEVTLNPRNHIERHFPELMINGRWIVSMTARENVRPTYGMANWAIREELETLRENSAWPRNAEELAAWLTPRDKQILSRRVNGAETEDFPAGVVYEADKQRLWLLNADGGIRAIAKLTRTDDGSTHFVYEKNGQTEYFDMWRVTRQLAPWIRHDGTPQQYGAFLLDDPLLLENDLNERPRRVRLQTDTGTWKMNTHANGKATVDRGTSTVEGRWTIKNGYVELTTKDGQTRRWAQAATGADTSNVPPESVQPWNYPERFAAIEPAIIEKPKTASALALEQTLERIRQADRDVSPAHQSRTEAREETREAAKRLQSSHEGR